ncbi:MAG: glycosyltransferase family 2 protein [Bacteroidia bacterium]
MKEPQHIQCKKVAVVLLGYNSVDYLAEFIPSVLKTDYDDFDLVYVDNASKDDSVNYVKEHFPEVKIFRIYENHGFTGGYTNSLPYIKAEYFVLLNSDVEVEPDWLKYQMERMESNEKLGAVQPKILHQKNKALFDYAGASGGYIDKFGYPFCRGRIFNHIEKDEGQYDDSRSIFWASGACMLVRSELYHRLGGLDNDFYAHMEEIDLCWRIKNAGYDIEVVPEAVVYHVGGSIISYGSFEKIYHNFRNNLVMMYKNLPSSLLIPRLIPRLFLDLAAAAKALVSGNFTEFRAILKADADFVFSLGKWKKNRNQAQIHCAVQPNTAGSYPRSIVSDFFVRGRKNFSELNY